VQPEWQDELLAALAVEAERLAANARIGSTRLRTKRNPITGTASS
jgi:hypothetical protein